MKIKSNLLGWGILIAAPLPFLVCLIHFLSKEQQLSDLNAECERIHTKVVQMQHMQKRESIVLAPLNNPDPHYLDKYVETLNFLLPEIKKLENLQDNEPAAKHLQRLQAHNRLTFSEDKIRSNSHIKETEEVQQYVVEINEEDLKRLLCLIEGVTIWPYGPKEGRPLLIIKDFKLVKKELLSKEKVYSLSMQLIKREPAQ